MATHSQCHSKTKGLSLPLKLAADSERRAAKLGCSYAAYIQALIAQDLATGGELVVEQRPRQRKPRRRILTARDDAALKRIEDAARAVAAESGR